MRVDHRESRQRVSQKGSGARHDASNAFEKAMARRGVLQLRKLQVHFCDFGGSSAGVREYLKDVLPKMAKDKPHAEIEEVVRRGRHPFVTGAYVHGGERVVCLRNKSSEEVGGTIASLCTTYGRKVKKIKKRTLTLNPSIQGAWTVAGQAVATNVASE